MARRVTKQCPACKQLFTGRRDAKTCSERCRKRLQRAAVALAKESRLAEAKIEAAAKQVEELVRPPMATEGGYIAISEPETLAVPKTGEDSLESPDPPASAAVSPTVLPASSSPITAAPSAAYQYDSRELEAEPQPYQPYPPNWQAPVKSPVWQSLGFSSRFIVATLIIALVSVAAISLSNYLGSKSPSSAAGSTTAENVLATADFNAHHLNINFDTTIANGRQLQTTGAVIIQDQTDSPNAFKIQNANGSNVLVADTKNNEITIGQKPPGQVSLNVNGDLELNGSLVTPDNSYSLSSQGLTLGGVLVCTARGCVSSNSPAPTPASPTIDVANLAYLNVSQSFTGNNGFSGQTSFKNTSTSAFQVQNSTGTDSLFLADTVNNRIGIGTTPSASGATLQVAGDLNVSSGVYRIGNVAGANLTCGPNELLQQGIISGGIITSGSCVTVAGSSTPTLQQVYDASTPSSITLSNASGVFQIQDAASPLATDLFEVTNDGASTKYFAVNSLGISVTGNVNTTGQYQVNGGQIASSNLADGANLAKLNANQTFSGVNDFTSASNTFSGDGSNLTNLNAGNIASGTLNNARLSASVTTQGNSFNGNSELVQLTSGGILPVLSGANLTSLNATNISTGTLNDLRLSSNVALLNANQTFSGNNSFTGNDSFTLSSAALTVQDASSPLGADLFTVTDNTGATKYFEVAASGAKVNGNDICTSAGNCVGTGGGGSIGGGGTTGTIAVFTGTGFTIGNSNLSQSGTTTNAAGDFNLTSGSQYQVNGSQISSANLSNDSNLAKLNANQTFTGNNIFALSTAGLAVQDAASPLGTDLFEVTDSSGSTKYFEVSATTAKVNGNDICTSAGNCVGTGGSGSIGGGGTAGKLAKFTGSGYTIGDSLISDNGTSLTLGGDTTVNGVLGVNTITPTATLTVGTASQTLTLQGDAGTSLSATASGITNQLVFAGPTVSNKTITLPDASGTVAVSASGPLSLDAAGNLTCPSCLTTDGSGGGEGVTGVNSLVGAITLAGTSHQVIITPTSNTLTFSTPQDIDTSSSPSFANINVTGQYQVGGTQISSSNLSDGANLAKLNANQTFTGNNTFQGSTEVQYTSTSAFEVQNASTPDNLFIADTSNHRIAIDQASANYPLDVAGDINTTTGYRVGGNAGTGITCSSGNVIQNPVVAGGIITGGSCVANGAGATTTLAQAYGNGGASTDQTLALATAKGGGLVIKDAATTVGSLFTVQNNAQNVNYLSVTASGIGVAGTVVASSTINTSGGTIQTGSTDRIDNSGNLVNIGNFTASAGSTFATTGANGFIFKPGTDNTTAFQVQNAAGTSTLLAVDTSDSNISLGQLTSGALAAWSTNANALPAVREEGGSVAANGYIYELSGANAPNTTAGQTTVYYAKLNSDGSTGSWTTDTNSLPMGLYATRSVTGNGYVYVIGGASSVGGSDVSTIYYAKLNTDGSTGAWNTNVNSLPAARSDEAAVAANGYVYVLGGSGSSTVYYAKINGDGSLGSWTTNTNSLPISTDGSTSAAAGGYVYLLANNNNSNVYYAKINGDGSLGSWTTSSNPLPLSPGDASSLVFDGYAYVYGGNSTSVYYAQLNADGSTGTWQTIANSLPTSLIRGMPAVANGYIYELGGEHSGTAQSTVYYASVQDITRNFGQSSIADQLTVGNGLTVAGSIALQASADSTSLFNLQNATGGNLINVDSVNSAITLDGNNTGQLSYWTTNANSLSASYGYSTSVTANGYVYLIGGRTSSAVQSTVYYAKLNADGSTGAWQTNANPLPQAVQLAGSIISNGYVYVLGGCTDLGCSSPVSTVYYAKLNADGSTGAWQTNANPLTNALSSAEDVTINGYIYVIGGFYSGSAQSTVYYAKLNADGSTGAWQTTSSITTGIDNGSAVVANGYVYVMGGVNSAGSTVSTVYHAQTNLNGTLGTWQTNANSLPQTVCLETSVVTNGYVYAMGGRNPCGSNTQSTVYYAKLNADGSTGAWQTNANSLPQAVYSAESITANGYVYVVGGGPGGLGPSIYYASTSRIQVGANLDLVGLQGGDLSDPGDQSSGSVGGSLTAGNGLFVGSLQVQGQGSFAQGVNITGNLTNNGSALFASSTGLTSAFQVQNTTGAQAINVNTVATPNLIPNGDFESTTNGWSGKGSATITRNDSNPSGYSGIGDLKISTTATANDGASFNYTFAASTQYTLSLYARSSSGTVSTINIGHQDVSGTDIDCLTGQSITTSWTRFTCTFTTGATITPPTQIYIKQSDATSRTFYIDAVQLEQAGSASAFQANQANFQVQTATNAIALDGNDSGALGPWTTNANNLPANRNRAGSVVANGYIYEIGGETTNGSNRQSTVYYAKLNADGSTGAWQTSTQPLPFANADFGTVTANGYVYMIGGCTAGTCSGPLTTTYYAKLNADGSTGAWQLSPNQLPQSIWAPLATITANGYVYLMGGYNNITSQTTIYYAKLNADGSTGAWQTNTVSLPVADFSSASVVANGYVYIREGTSLHYAKLNSDGSVGSWTTVTGLANVQNLSSAVVSNGYMYVLGGNYISSDSTVYYAKLNADGSTGTWQSTTSMPAPRYAATSVSANGYVYMLGGNDASNTNSTVYYASTPRIQVGANLDLVGLQGGTLSDPGNQSGGSVGGSLTAGNGLFVGSLQVQGQGSFAQGVNIAGNLTDSGSALFQSSTGLTNAFQVQTTNGLQAININTGTTPNLVANSDFESTTNGWSGKGAATITRNDTTAIGAASGTGSLKISTTAAANDGAYFNYTFAASTTYTLSLYAYSASSISTVNIGHQDVSGTDIDCLTGQTVSSSWTRYTCTFTTGATITPPTQIYIKQTDATSRIFYIDAVQLEQASSTSAFQANQANFQVQTATNIVTLDGSNSGALGSWSTNANSLPTTEQEASSVTANGYVYVLGNGTGVYYAKLNADGSTGAWQTSANSLPNNIRLQSSITANGFVYSFGGATSGGTSVCSSGGTAISSVYYAKLNADGSTGAWQTNTNSLPQTIYCAASASANGYAYVMGGYNGSSDQSTVYYAKLNADGSTGAWQTNTNALLAARKGGTAVISNGYVYYLAGVGHNDVYYAKVNSDGSIGAWSSTTFLPSSADGSGTVVSNGYIYFIGGMISGTTQSTVYYAKLNSDGTVGSWKTNANPLPVNRAYATTVISSGYVYELGGTNCNGSCSTSTVYYASTSRIQIGASIDLVGLQGGTLADPGDQSAGSSGGSITAGNGIFVGSLQVQGTASFAQGVTITGNLNISSSTGSLLLAADATNSRLTVAGNVLADSTATATSTYSTTGTAQVNVTSITVNSPTGFNVNDVIFIDNAGQDYYTRITNIVGNVFTVDPAVSVDANSGSTPAVTKYTAQYIGSDGTNFSGSTRNQNSFFQGYFTGGVVTGAGSTVYSDGNIKSVNALQVTAPSIALTGTVTSSGNVQIAGGSFLYLDASSGSYISQSASGALTINASTAGGGNGNIILQAASSDAVYLGYGSSNTVYIGTGSGSSTPTLLVLGNKNTSGDPTCTSGAMYYNSNSNAFRFCQNGSWVGLGSSYSAPSYVTSLPGSPTDGQEVYYNVDPTNGIVWHLRYNGTSGYWEFLGGSPLNVSATTVTLPNAGDYTINFGWTFTGGNNGYSSVGLSTGSGTLSGHTSAGVGGSTSAGGTTGVTADVTGFAKVTGVSASDVISHTSPSGGNAVSGEWYEVTPIRIQ